MPGEPARASSAADPSAAPDGPVSFGPPERDPRGDAYRLVLETSGERETSVEGRPPAPPRPESYRLELELRELSTESRRGDASRLVLEGLRSVRRQQRPKAEREIELADDRLRIRDDGEETLDLRGAQPREDLTPRKLLGQIFAVVSSRPDDPDGRVVVRPRGGPVARRFLDGLPVRQAIGYARVPLPERPVSPGESWRAVRYPAGPAGTLGLGLEVVYTLAGFEVLDGVPCAWILLRVAQNESDVTSAAGFRFDHVKSSLDGMAWVELATSRLRRLVLEDEIRAVRTSGEAPAPRVTERLRHGSRLRLELRDPEATPRTWADGTKRFDSR